MLTKYVRLLLSFAQAFWILYMRFPRLTYAEKMLAIQGWSQHVLHIMGVTLRVNAAPACHVMATAPQLLVANHISWLDVLVIQSQWPSVFVAKKEVLAWPILGLMARACDTVFVDRQSPSSARKMVKDVVQAMARGHRVAGFPEGTSSEGHTVHLFHANLFEAAIEHAVAVQPVALRYTNAQTGGHCQAAAFVGDMGFVASLHKVMRTPALTVSLQVGVPLSSSGHSRRTLAHVAHRWVRTQLEL